MTFDRTDEDQNDCQTAGKRAKTRSSAAYVARVGGLAVALGIGTAVAGGQAIAHAETTGETSSPTSNDSSPTSNDAPPSDPGQPDDGQLDGQPGVTPSDKKNFSSPFRQSRIPAILGISPNKGDNNTVSAGLTDPETASKSRRLTDPPGKRTKRADEVVNKSDELTNISAALSKPRRVTLPSDRPQIDVNPARVFTRPTISKMTDEVDPARTATVPTPPVGTLSVDGNQPDQDIVAAAQRAGTGNTNRIVTSLVGSTAVDSPATDPVAPVAPPSVLEVLTWAWRDFNRTFVNVANLAQIAQGEPLGRAQVAPMVPAQPRSRWGWSRKQR